MRKSILLLLLTLVLASCTTQKRKNDLSLIGKIYQNTTARYNGYFNANELMLETFESLETNNQDNYNKLLPIYTYTEPDNPQTYFEDLDKAIEKVTVVINLHRPSHWVDDCYLLMGKAQFLKQDYEGAEQTFRFLTDEYPPEFFDKKKNVRDDVKAERTLQKTKEQVKKNKQQNIKKRKKEAKKRAKARKKYNQQVRKNRARKKKGKKAKSLKKPGSKEVESKKSKRDSTKLKLVEETPAIEEEPDTIIGLISIFDNDGEGATETNPEKFFLKHRPAFQEGTLWLTKALIERDKYGVAERYLSRLDNDNGTFDDVRRELYPLKAYYFIRQKLYDNAIQPLQDAIKFANDREKKARYSFILAQIYQLKGSSQDAFVAFKNAMKYSANYEMEFSAKLNLVQSGWVNGTVTEVETLKQLEKMLKDDKNISYKDRIYFMIASIALKAGRKDEAIKNLELALANSSQNKIQKAESYYQLAKLYFESENYVAAKLYYDSTSRVLPKTDDRYFEVELYSKKLKEVATHIQEIQLQDSLLRISNLSEEEKRKFAFEIKKKQEEERRALLAAAANKANNRAASVRASTPSAIKSNSSWFAYDDKALKRGIKEFQRNWGGRPLEDNWRLSERRSEELGNEEFGTGEIANTVLTDEDVAEILKDVPKNKQEAELAKLKIKKAMFELGKAYRNDLERNDKAAEILEDLDNTYPGNSFELDSWYYLYLVHKDLNNLSKQEFYKNKIIDKFPSSKYAQLLQNPNYLEELQDEEKQLNTFYDLVYSDFNSQKYQQAFNKIREAESKFGSTNLLQPRFALLNAMCLGQIKGKDAYLDALKEVIAKYPNTDEQKRAREIMRLLGKPIANLPGGNSDNKDEDRFKLEEDKSHYILVAFGGDVKTNDKKRAISDYNRKYHKLDKLGLTAMFLNSGNSDNRQPLIVIRRFKNKEAAMGYFVGVQNNLPEFLPNDGGVPYEIFAVSLNNYRQILRSRSLEGYKEFFDAYYQD